MLHKQNQQKLQNRQKKLQKQRLLQVLKRLPVMRLQKNLKVLRAMKSLLSHKLGNKDTRVKEWWLLSLTQVWMSTTKFFASQILQKLSLKTKMILKLLRRRQELIMVNGTTTRQSTLTITLTVQIISRKLRENLMGCTLQGLQQGTLIKMQQTAKRSMVQLRKHK